MTLKIRTATENDIHQIMNIEEKGFIEPIREEQSVFLNRIKINPELFLIFEFDNNVAGYLSAEYMSEIPDSAEDLKLDHTPSADAEKNYIYISSYSLLPEYRGNRNGSLCWNKALDYLGSNKKYVLLVNEAWPAAKHIYQKSGFKEIKTFKDFFPTEEETFTAGTLMIK